MKTVERIELIERQPEGTVFLVKKHGKYWQKDDNGYTNNKVEAKKFSRRDILSRMRNYGLLDKEIVLEETEEVICPVL